MWSILDTNSLPLGSTEPFQFLSDRCYRFVFLSHFSFHYSSLGMGGGIEDDVVICIDYIYL